MKPQLKLWTVNMFNMPALFEPFPGDGLAQAANDTEPQPSAFALRRAESAYANPGRTYPTEDGGWYPEEPQDYTKSEAENLARIFDDGAAFRRKQGGVGYLAWIDDVIRQFVHAEILPWEARWVEPGGRNG